MLTKQVMNMIDNKLKGIKKSRSKEFNFEQYYNCLYDYEYTKEVSQKTLRSINHDFYMQKLTKKFLSPFDDKRKHLYKIESVPNGYC